MVAHSPLKEFLDPTRKKICLLDEERVEILFGSRYDDFKSNCVKFYVLCGYDRCGRYDENFWERDLQSVFDRAELLRRYNCLPYVMRHENYRRAPNPRV